MMTRELKQASILIVDDEEANADLLEGLLVSDEYTRVRSTRDPREALSLFGVIAPDLVLLDLHMPHMDGFALMRELNARLPPGSYLPILVLTADITPEAKQQALSEGAKDFLTKPIDAVEALLRIRNLLEARFLHLEQRSAREAAEAAERRAKFLAEASRVLGTSFDYHTTLATLARLAVPELADYCVVDVIEDDGAYLQLGAAHVDSDREALLRGGLRDGRLRNHPLEALFRRGESLLVARVTPAILDEVLGTGEHRRLIDRLDPRSAIVAPLTVAARLIGGITLVCSESDRCYGPEDLRLAEALARRAALAVDNARLFLHAQEATRARDEMLAVVAHDLRNPLNTIMMAADLLRDESVPRSQTPLEIVQRSAERMNRLIQDLLDVTRMEGGGISLEPRAEDAAELVTEAFGMLQPLAAAEGIRLEQEVEAALPTTWIDPSRILQVLSNLVGNAIKFTPPGGRITVTVRPEGEELLVSVADTGPGIPPEQIPHIFGRFWQANRADRRGIGLGLAIARGIVEAHGGRIWVESTPGVGSTFLFTLPRASAAGDAGIPADRATAGREGARPLVAPAG